MRSTAEGCPEKSCTLPYELNTATKLLGKIYVLCDDGIKFGFPKKVQVFDGDTEKNAGKCDIL
jgi:hypothetical protein